MDFPAGKTGVLLTVALAKSRRIINALTLSKHPEPVDLDKGIEIARNCSNSGILLLNDINQLAELACPLLRANGQYTSLEISSLCTDTEHDNSSLQADIELETNVVIFSIDIQGTFIKMNTLGDELIYNFSYTEEKEVLNGTKSGELSRTLLCTHLYPTVSDADVESEDDSKAERLPFCSSVCANVKLLSESVERFVEFKKLPTMALLSLALKELCVSSSEDEFCWDVDEFGTVYNRTTSSVPAPKFCVDFMCKFPLTRTSNSHHWYDVYHRGIETVSDGAAYLFPSASLPFNKSIFPCGVSCSTVSFTADQEKLMRMVRFLCGCIGLVFTVIAITAYVLNREKLKKLPRRLNFYLNLAFLFGPGVDSFLAVGTDSMKQVYCHGDNTLRFNEPQDGMSLCLFLAIKFLFFSFMMGCLGMVLCHEWCVMIFSLAKARAADLNVADSLARERKREIIYLLASSIASAILTAAIVAQKSIVGQPNTGGCFLRVKQQFYFFGIPLMIQALLMTGYLIYGLPKLAKVYKGLTGYLDKLQGHLRSSVSDDLARRQSRRQSNAMSGLEGLIHLLSIYIALLLTSQLVVLPIFIYQYSVEDDVVWWSGRRHSCLSSRCDTSTCPQLYLVSPAVTIVPDVFLTVVGIVLSLWALRWEAFWQKHFQCLRAKLCSSYRLDRRGTTETLYKSSAPGSRRSTGTNNAIAIARPDLPSPEQSLPKFVAMSSL